MRKTVMAAAAAVLLLSGLSACDSGDATPSPADPTVPTTEAPDVSEDESGPESPIAYGLQVPEGATQLGPTARYRSARLIAEYQPELDAATAQLEAEERDAAADAERRGTPVPSTVPAPDTRPSDDSFDLLEQTPIPDTAVSLMRIDGDPSDVLRRMLAQISAALPDKDIEFDDLTQFCRTEDRRITECSLTVSGLTVEDREIRIDLDVDPGNLATRTSPPSSLTRPVMSLSVQYVGEPRAGQLERETNALEDVPAVTEGAGPSGMIWPQMDEDAPPTTKLVNGWVAPSSASIILSGFDPKFVGITTQRAVDADLIAQQFAASNGADGEYSKDVVVDLNEVTTTYTATAEDNSVARAIYVLSARGNYTMLFYDPAEN